MFRKESIHSLKVYFSQEIFTELGPVVRRPISANPRLNFDLGFFITLLKCLFGIISCFLMRPSNSHILDKKNSTEFCFVLGYLNPNLNNPALEYNLNVAYYKKMVC